MLQLLIHTCKIQTRGHTTNGFGEKEYTWTDTFIGVPCRFYQPSSKFVGGMDRKAVGEFVRKLPKIFLKKDQVIVEENRIVGTKGFEEMYDVESIKKVNDSVGVHHIECELKKVV